MVFAGLYYSVNKLGAHYGQVSEEGEGESSGVPPEMLYVATDEGVESFCGMDINTFIEGECLTATYGCACRTLWHCIMRRVILSLHLLGCTVIV